jgi:Asp/Glu/hydantoin racemase
MAIDTVTVLHGPTVIKGVDGGNIAITTVQFELDANTVSESVDNLLIAAFTGTVPTTLPAGPGNAFGAPIGPAFQVIGICDGGGATALVVGAGSGVVPMIDQVAQTIEFRRGTTGAPDGCTAVAGLQATLMVSY